MFLAPPPAYLLDYPEDPAILEPPKLKIHFYDGLGWAPKGLAFSWASNSLHLVIDFS